MSFSLTPREKSSMLEKIIEAMNVIDAIPVSTPCRKCQHGENSHGKYCEYFSQDVPCDYQDKGCHNFTETIPF